SNGAGQELNSFSMYAVGSGTTMEYLQSMAGLDDSFEWFGGAVDMRYLVSYESGDDHFDWTEGYSGRNQFLIALQTTVITPRVNSGSVSSDPRGFEGDGCESDKSGCQADFSNTPFSMPVFANFAVIGPGAGVFTPADGNGAVIRRGAGATLVNGIIGRWPAAGISLRDQQSETNRLNDSVTVRNIILVDNGAPFQLGTAPAQNAIGFAGAAPGGASYAIDQLTGVTSLFTALPAQPTMPTVATLDWTAAGAAITGGMASFTGTKIAPRVNGYFGGTIAGTAYRGPGDPAGAKWWQGWTVYYRN
ncbi:MAG: hypothetical protein ABJD07_08175, partial [Gemmatimonadaceae bacterium]